MQVIREINFPADEFTARSGRGFYIRTNAVSYQTELRFPPERHSPGEFGLKEDYLV